MTAPNDVSSAEHAALVLHDWHLAGNGDTWWYINPSGGSLTAFAGRWGLTYAGHRYNFAKGAPVVEVLVLHQRLREVMADPTADLTIYDEPRTNGKYALSVVRQVVVSYLDGREEIIWRKP